MDATPVNKSNSLYREIFLESDKKRIQLLSLLWIAGAAVLLTNDAEFVAEGYKVFFISLRISFITAAAVMNIILFRIKTVKTFDKLTFALLLLIVLFEAIIIYTRPATYTLGYVLSIPTLIGILFVAPLSFFKRLIILLTFALPWIVLVIFFKDTMLKVKASMLYSITLSSILLFFFSELYYGFRQKSFLGRRALEKLLVYAGAMLSSSDRGIVIDENGKAVSVNDTFSKMLGKDKSEICGREIESFIDKDSEDHFIRSKENGEYGVAVKLNSGHEDVWVYVSSDKVSYLNEDFKLLIFENVENKAGYFNPENIENDEKIRAILKDAMKRYKLTKREQEVAFKICAGLSYRKCSLELGISEETVKKHVQNIYKKTSVNSRRKLLSTLSRFKNI